LSIILDRDTKVIVQGITGREGRFHTASMLKYGTNIVGGVTPGKGGEEVEGVPVYNTVNEAVARGGADTSIMFVPPRFARSAIIEAIEAGLKTVVVIVEGLPHKDAIECMARAKAAGDTIVIGPNCPGIICPTKQTKAGIMPNHIFRAGNIGIVSRSGSLTYEIAWHTTKAGLGQSTCVGIGGDAIIGLDFVGALKLFRDDDETGSIIIIGEIGGNAEEAAAAYVVETGYPKPIVAYVAGRMAPPGKRMGHAGAIVMGEAGTARSKIDAFTAAGIPVADRPSQIVGLLRS